MCTVNLGPQQINFSSRGVLYMYKIDGANVTLNFICGLDFLMNFKKKVYFSSNLGQGPFLFYSMSRFVSRAPLLTCRLLGPIRLHFGHPLSLSSVFKSKLMFTRLYQIFKSEIQIWCFAFLLNSHFYICFQFSKMPHFFDSWIMRCVCMWVCV